MYHHGVQNGYQTNTQDNAFQYLNRKFAGRGLAMQVKTSADSYGAEGMYGYRGATSAPLTLGEFEQNYRSRSLYAGVPVNVNTHRTQMQKLSSRPVQRQQAARTVQTANATRTKTASAYKQSANTASATSVSGRTQVQKSPEKVPVRRENAPKLPSTVRRAVKNNTSKKENNPVTLVRNFSHLPVGALLTVVICAVSLMFIVGSSVLLSDASNKYADMQNEISALAKQEDELLIALEVKNDLRTIEDIAVNKLGMVKKDLVTRQYIKISDEDMIETFDDENTNVGLTTLLSAIRGGN